MSLLKVNSVTDLAGDTPAGVGRILQVVSTAKTDTFSTTSASFGTVTGLTATITPSSSSSKVLIVAQITASVSVSGSGAFRLSGGNSTTYVGDAASSRLRAVFGLLGGQGVSNDNDRIAHSFSIVYQDSPNTTSATTYEVQAYGSNGTLFVNRSGNDTDSDKYVRGTSSITVMEMAG